MAEDAIRDDYEDKYLGGGEDDVIERLAEIDDETADQRAQALLEGLEDYDLDEEDRALLGAWGFDIEDEEEQLADPVVAIVGRPNVGKSTIINRILGRREAVVEDKPGVTRDRVSYKAEWLGKSFTLVDTGGWESDARGIDAQVAEQAEIAVEQADVVVLVVDARVGVTASYQPGHSPRHAQNQPAYSAATTYPRSGDPPEPHDAGHPAPPAEQTASAPA